MHKCKKCDRVFESVSQLGGHQSVHREAGKQFKCKKCGLVFESVAKLAGHHSSKHIVHERKVRVPKPGICENCGLAHDGMHASGRFCSAKCSYGFSTKNKRKEISEKVSKSLVGRSTGRKGIQGPRASEETRHKIALSVERSWIKRFEVTGKKRRTVEQKRAYNLHGVRIYHLTKRNAIPQDADLDLIAKIYENRPAGYHVDHIVPLSKGGLHHQDNLQYLPAAENYRKSNRDEYDKSLAIPWKLLIK